MSVHFPFRVCTLLFWSFFPRYNNCSPFFYLFKCVEIMWFGFVFIEKNAKNKKKTRCFSKSFTSSLHNGSTSEHNSTRFRKLQCRATTFVLTIFGNWSCDQPPSDLLDGPWYVKSSLSCFSSLFIKLYPFPLLGRTMTWTLKAVPDGRYNIYAILFLLETAKFPFLDISFGPWNCHPTMLMTILIFFWFFGYFIAIFHLEMMK